MSYNHPDGTKTFTVGGPAADRVNVYESDSSVFFMYM